MRIRVAVALWAVAGWAGACASSGVAPLDAGAVRVVEQPFDREKHLDLPRTLKGCEHLGIVGTPTGTERRPTTAEPAPGVRQRRHNRTARG